jgi:tRNA nucleotidyltransferase (CCA-adding enzyme)
VKVYLVGGAVRDQLLGLPVKERDWVVVGATAEQMLARGFKQADADFPVFLHPNSGEEYALARTETKTGAGYKGFDVEFGPEVTLEQDLLRRDLTINALALDEEQRLIDPCRGRSDLQRRLLRHITPAFEEDPVRLLRVARFAAYLGRFGFRVAGETLSLLRSMAESRDLLALQRERIWKEMARALGEKQPWRFFELLREFGALKVLLPELAVVLGDDGNPEESPVIGALKRAVHASEDPAVRFAVVFAEAASITGDPVALCESLRAPREYRDLLDLVVQYGGLFDQAAEGGAESILQLLRFSRAQQQPERFQRFLLAIGALRPEVSVVAVANIEKALSAVASISAEALREQGLNGNEVGAEMERLRLAAIRDQLQVRS